MIIITVVSLESSRNKGLYTFGTENGGMQKG